MKLNETEGAARVDHTAMVLCLCPSRENGSDPEENTFNIKLETATH
jgi:hypothetical protein